MVFCQCYPNSDWKYAVAGLSFGLAALTGGLRMASGNHFFSDVLAGAAIGTVVGFAIPYMHTKTFYGKFERKSGKANAALNPAGFSFSYNFKHRFNTFKQEFFSFTTRNLPFPEFIDNFFIFINIFFDKS